MGTVGTWETTFFLLQVCQLPHNCFLFYFQIYSFRFYLIYYPPYRHGEHIHIREKVPMEKEGEQWPKPQPNPFSSMKTQEEKKTAAFSNKTLLDKQTR